MIGEWIRFGLCAAFLLAGLFIMVVSIIGLYRFDFALQRIHAAALGDTLSLLLFTIGILIAVGFHAVAWKLVLVLVLALTLLIPELVQSFHRLYLQIEPHAQHV